MSQRDCGRSGYYKCSGSHAYHEDDDDDQGHQSESSYFRPKSDVIVDIPSFQDEEKKTDNDSGIYNSSKATTSLGSNSEQEESEGEERAASFDYFPSATTGKIPQMFHTDYDEAYDVDSEKGSQVDIESPRSDKSANKDSDQEYYHETEMTSFRNFSRGCDDFETDEESDEDKSVPHRYMYSGGRRSGNYYTPMTPESTEEYGQNMSSSTFSFDNSRRALKDKSASALRGVDESINFPLGSPTSRYSSYSRYNNSSSTGTRVEKSMYSRHDIDDEVFTTGAKDPPFGHGRDQVDKVGKSICSLLSNSASTVDDMPEGRPVAQSLDLEDDGQRRKKKKKRSKDDVDDKTRRSADYDENGNPLDRYLQIRSSPKFGSGSIQRKNFSTGFPATIREFAPYSVAQTPISELESSHYQSRDQSRAKKKLYRRKQKQESFTKAEDVENYVGNKGLDELLNFIEGDKNDRKPKKSKKKK